MLKSTTAELYGSGTFSFTRKGQTIENSCAILNHHQQSMRDLFQHLVLSLFFFFFWPIDDFLSGHSCIRTRGSGNNAKL